MCDKEVRKIAARGIIENRDITMQNKLKQEELPKHRYVVLTGLVGIFAAIMTGAGEFLLHYSDLANYADDGQYAFLLNVSEWRLTSGHFIGVLAAPLYLIGMWHMYLGLKPYNQKAAFILFVISSYGFVLGAVWMGSRSGIALLAQANAENSSEALVTLINYYILHSETLLQVIRVTTLLTSVGFIIMVLSGKTLYPKWMALFNPIVLLIMSFVVFAVAPSIGKYTLPIALNVGYFLFFTISTMLLAKRCKQYNERS